MIGVIGYGFVGKAMCHIIRDNHICLVVDPAIDWALSLEMLIKAKPEFIFICVPTPSKLSYECNDSLVMEYVNKLIDYDGVLIMKSTVPPSTVDKIISVRPDTVIWPEFLREDHALDDITYPSVIAIGALRTETFDKMKTFINESSIEASEGCSIRHVTPVEASIFKYTVNSFLAMKVVFMHEMALLTDGRGSNWNNVVDLLAIEGRVGASHLDAPGKHGYGFDGSCFPKDTKALAAQGKLDGANLSLLEAAIEANYRLRRENA